MRNIDPRHLVAGIARKPGAFAHYVFRDDFLKNHKYRYIWEYVSCTMQERLAGKFMVRLLKLGYGYGFEEEAANLVIDWIKKKKSLDIKALENRFIPKQKTLPLVETLQHSLSSYGDLVQQGARS